MKSIVHVKFYIHYEIGGSDFEISNGRNICILDFFSNRIIYPYFLFLIYLLCIVEISNGVKIKNNTISFLSSSSLIILDFVRSEKILIVVFRSPTRVPNRDLFFKWIFIFHVFIFYMREHLYSLYP